jgi:hypothetical protein
MHTTNPPHPQRLRRGEARVGERIAPLVLFTREIVRPQEPRLQCKVTTPISPCLRPLDVVGTNAWDIRIHRAAGPLFWSGVAPVWRYLGGRCCFRWQEGRHHRLGR